MVLEGIVDEKFDGTGDDAEFLSLKALFSCGNPFDGGGVLNLGGFAAKCEEGCGIFDVICMIDECIVEINSFFMAAISFLHVC